MAYVNGVWVAEPGQETDPYYDREPPPPSTTDPSTDPLDRRNPGDTDPVVPDPVVTDPLDEALPENYTAARNAALDRPSTEFAGYEQTGPAQNVATAENYITPETTVAGNLNKYLDPDSPLNKMAVARKREQAQAMGGSLSSMAVGATQAALYQQAGDFASKDMEHASKVQQSEQQAENMKRQIAQEAQVAGDLNVQTAQIRDAQQKIEQGWEATMQGMAAKDTEELTIMRENAETARQNALNTLNASINSNQISSDLSVMIMNNTNTRLNNWSLEVQELTQDAEWMAMMGAQPGGTAGFFNDQLRVITSGAEFDAASAGLSGTYAPIIKNLWAANRYGNEAY